MSLTFALQILQDELDSQQIAAKLVMTPKGVHIEADDYTSRLIARSELRKRGFDLFEQKKLRSR